MTGEKAPSKKKFSKLGELKKQLIISSFVAAFAISGIVGGIYIFNLEQQKKEVVLNIDMDYYLNSFDPLYNPNDLCFRDNAVVWSQIIEGLFEHNQSREDTPIIPCLAKDFGKWSLDGLNYTVPLKENVKFHDGTPFNATAVKWNFDRIYRFIEIMPGSHIWVWDYMYILPNGKPIINETVVIDKYTVRFVLNEPYIPLRALLTAFQSCILSPTSTPANDYVDKFTGKLIGTGPYILDDYVMIPVHELCGNVTIVANKKYWELKPKIDKVHFEHFGEDETMVKMLSDELHYTLMRRDFNSTILEVYKNATNIHAIPSVGLVVHYIAMNYDIFPLEMRKAFSFAFNYTDYIKILFEDRNTRCKSPLSKGMLYSNWDLNIAYTNIQIARQLLINASWPGTSGLTANDNISAGNEWEKKVENGTPLATYNFSIEADRESHILQASLIAKYFKQIGVKVEPLNLTPQEWWYKMLNGGMEFWAVGWGPAFNDPVEMLNPLFHTNAPYNFLNFSDSQIDDWIEQGVAELNETAREQLYYDIQKTLVEDLYPVVWTHSPVSWGIWTSNVKGIPLEGAGFKFILKYAYIEET